MEGTVADMFLSTLDYFPDKESLRESVAGKSKKKSSKVVDMERVWEMAKPIKSFSRSHNREESDGDDEDDDDVNGQEKEDILGKHKGRKTRRGRIPLDPRTAEHRWTGR